MNNDYLQMFATCETLVIITYTTNKIKAPSGSFYLLSAVSAGLFFLSLA